MNKPIIGKVTSASYGLDYQLAQADKYRNRSNNHWKYRIELARNLVEKHLLPRFFHKQNDHIVVVDIGCSVGAHAIEFAKLGFQSYGIDFDDNALKIAKQLCNEEGVTVKFVQGDISAWNKIFPPIDIAVCFDIFEHLHDDELGSLLHSVRRQLSTEGGIVFHTFPTQYDYLFYRAAYRRLPLLLCSNFTKTRFSRIVKAYATLVDTFLLLTENRTYRERIKFDRHCNPLTKERLIDILNRAGYRILYIEAMQLYPYKMATQKQFMKQPITYRNICGVAVLQTNRG